jgi:hypothetical protein
VYRGLPLDGELLATAIIVPVGGYLAGRHMGRFARYGALPGLLRDSGVTLCAEPRSVDGAAGLKPLGDFYFLMAGVLAIPMAFFAAWLAIMHLTGVSEAWKRPYEVYLAVIGGLEVLAFVLPLWSFHRAVATQKAEFLRSADHLAAKIAVARRDLEAAEDADGMQRIKDRLENLTDAYASYEDMPTWPVDATTRRRFTLRNVALFLPLVPSLVALPPWLVSLVDPVKQILTGS